jgi:hypothetical protein
MNDVREPAGEAVAAVDSSATGSLAAASITPAKADRPARRTAAARSASAFARPHDPPHLHTFSLLI